MLTYSDPDAADLAPDRLARAYAYLEEMTQTGQVPGAALLIARHGQAVEPRAFGSPTLAGIGGLGCVRARTPSRKLRSFLEGVCNIYLRSL